MTTTAGTTSRGYRYPGDASATDVPGDLKKLADDVNTDVAAVAADGAVTTAKIADSAVTSAKIADGTIVDADINAAAGIAKTKITGTALVESTATTKGDLLARGTSAVERLAVGAVGTNPILIPDTSASAGVKWGTWTEADVAQASKVGNLLTLNQATGTDTLSDTTGFYLGGNGSSLASSATYAWQGTRSASYVAGGTASAYMNLHHNGSPAGSLMAVTPGLTYTGVAMLRASAADTLRMELWWYNSGGASIGSSTGASITASTSAWTRATVSAAAPAGAAYAQLSVHRQSGTAGSTVYGDGFGLWLGAGGDWQLPGVPITGIGHKTDNTAGKATYLWDETVPGWRLAVYDSGWRDVSAALEAGASGTLLIRRTATNVHVLSFNVTSSSDTIYIAPAGFAPGSGTEGIVAPVAKFDGTVGAMTFNSPAGGHMALSAGIKAYAGAYLSAVFPVRTAIPTSLPGTQATAPV